MLAVDVGVELGDDAGAGQIMVDAADRAIALDEPAGDAEAAVDAALDRLRFVAELVIGEIGLGPRQVDRRADHPRSEAIFDPAGEADGGDLELVVGRSRRSCG